VIGGIQARVLINRSSIGTLFFVAVWSWGLYYKEISFIYFGNRFGLIKGEFCNQILTKRAFFANRVDGV
jgi:hypothetical protein